jgi:hypothetical protein
MTMSKKLVKVTVWLAVAAVLITVMCILPPSWWADILAGI